MTVDLIQRTSVDELRSHSSHVRGDPSVLDTSRELSLWELIYPIVVAYLIMMMMMMVIVMMAKTTRMMMMMMSIIDEQ